MRQVNGSSGSLPLPVPLFCKVLSAQFGGGEEVLVQSLKTRKEMKRKANEMKILRFEMLSLNVDNDTVMQLRARFRYRLK